jgi:fructose-bisphosphate aldolase class I
MADHLIKELFDKKIDRRIEEVIKVDQNDEEILRDEILRHLEGVPEGQQVMLKLSIPAKPGTFDALVRHPRVLCVVALSGGFSRADACAELAKNSGMIASFSRALLSDLRQDMSDEEFDRSLAEAIDEIYDASTEKVAA